jgi:hypothetical protein
MSLLTISAMTSTAHTIQRIIENSLVKVKHQKGIALLTKTKHAIATSAEEETDNL